MLRIARGHSRVGRARGLVLAAALPLFGGCAGLMAPVVSEGSGAQSESAATPVAAPEPREVRVSLERDGLAEVLRARYIGAWVSVRPPGQFLKSVIRLEFPSSERKAFVCAVGADYVGICRPPPNREMRVYPLAHVQITFGEHCSVKGACADPAR